MIAYILAGITVVVTLGIVAFIGFGNGMSDAPTERGTPVWPTLVTGGIIAALLVGSHFTHMSW